MKDKDPVIAREVPDVYTFVGTFDNAQACSIVEPGFVHDEDRQMVERRDAARSSHADDSAVGNVSAARTIEEMTVDRLIRSALSVTLGDALVSCSCRRPFSKVKQRGKAATAAPTELRVTVPREQAMGLERAVRMSLMTLTDIDVTWDQGPNGTAW